MIFNQGSEMCYQRKIAIYFYQKLQVFFVSTRKYQRLIYNQRSEMCCQKNIAIDFISEIKGAFLSTIKDENVLISAFIIYCGRLLAMFTWWKAGEVSRCVR